jgi:tetratricopeptide (TPR) repeat protein
MSSVSRAHAEQSQAKFNRAAALHRAGELAAAETLCGQILSGQPAHAGALHLLGVIAGQAGHWTRAAELIGQAIWVDPGSADAYCDRGVALKALTQWDAALSCYNRAIALQPDHAEAYCNRGNVLHELKRYEAAIADYDSALAIRPDYATAYYNRGVVLADLRQWNAALASYERALAIKPDHAIACCNCGAVLEQLGRFEAALARYDEAIALQPRYAQAHSNRGNVLRKLQQLDGALSSCSTAIAIDRAYAQAYSNRAAVLYELNRLDEALADCDRAIALAPDLARAHCNRAYTRLLLGDFKRGWIDQEWRWKGRDGALVRRDFSQPLWLGKESLTGKTILLHGEQGLGDTIQFCRYAKMVCALGATVLLEAQGPLIGALTGLEGAARIFAGGDALPSFDYHCPLLSLPLAFETTLATVPAGVPYLRSNPKKTAHWKAKLGTKRRFRVGLVWSGGFRANLPELWAVNSRRNIPLATLAVIMHPQIEFYSLQKGRPAESELTSRTRDTPDGPEIIDHTAELVDFSDTAALIDNLDLVISVDTSTAHLAGALAKPVWILNRFDSCWRWLSDRTDSPWYPTATLYRQSRAGDWEGVVQRVKRDLERLATVTAG